MENKKKHHKVYFWQLLAKASFPAEKILGILSVFSLFCSHIVKVCCLCFLKNFQTQLHELFAFIGVQKVRWRFQRFFANKKVHYRVVLFFNAKMSTPPILEVSDLISTLNVSTVLFFLAQAIFSLVEESTKVNLAS